MSALGCLLVLLTNVRSNHSKSMVHGALGALDQYRHTTLWVVGSSLVGAQKMLLWKKLVLGMMFFSRYTWLRNQPSSVWIGARSIVGKGQLA
jgi:hypothetical protein